MLVYHGGTVVKVWTEKANRVGAIKNPSTFHCGQRLCKFADILKIVDSYWEFLSSYCIDMYIHCVFSVP